MIYIFLPKSEKYVKDKREYLKSATVVYQYTYISAIIKNYNDRILHHQAHHLSTIILCRYLPRMHQQVLPVHRDEGPR